MAYRLPVIILCNSGSAKTSGMDAGRVVGYLLGVSGLDVRLVSEIPNVEDRGKAVAGGVDVGNVDEIDNAVDPESILLRGIRGAIAVLAWQRCDQTFDQIAAAGLRGQRTSHVGDPVVVPPSPGLNLQRPIFAFDLTSFLGLTDEVDPVERLAGELIEIAKRLDLGANSASQKRSDGIASGGLPVLPVVASRSSERLVRSIEPLGKMSVPGNAESISSMQLPAMQNQNRSQTESDVRSQNRIGRPTVSEDKLDGWLNDLDADDI